MLNCNLDKPSHVTRGRLSPFCCHTKTRNCFLEWEGWKWWWGCLSMISHTGSNPAPWLFFFFSCLHSVQMPVFHLESLFLVHHKTSAVSSSFLLFLSHCSLLFDQHPESQTHAHHPPAPLPRPVYFCRSSYGLLQFVFKDLYVASQRKTGFRNMEHLDLTFVAGEISKTKAISKTTDTRKKKLLHYPEIMHYSC